MSKTYKKIRLHPYDPTWPKMFEVEAADIRAFLGAHCLDIHHMGSTAVPGLTAKCDIDIMLIVDHLSNARELEKHGFVYKGEFNIPLRHFYSKNTERSKVNLHVVEPGHGFIAWNLTFRDYLRTHNDTRDAYGALKVKIAADESSGERIQHSIPRYTYNKGLFIVDIINKAGFDGYMVNFCFHEHEWDAFHRILATQDRPAYPFVLYKGTKIVAAADVAVEDGSVTILRIKDDEQYLRDYIAKWASTLFESSGH